MRSLAGTGQAYPQGRRDPSSSPAQILDPNSTTDNELTSIAVTFLGLALASGARTKRRIASLSARQSIIDGDAKSQIHSPDNPAFRDSRHGDRHHRRLRMHVISASELARQAWAGAPRGATGLPRCQRWQEAHVKRSAGIRLRGARGGNSGRAIDLLASLSNASQKARSVRSVQPTESTLG